MVNYDNKACQKLLNVNNIHIYNDFWSYTTETQIVSQRGRKEWTGFDWEKTTWLSSPVQTWNISFWSSSSFSFQQKKLQTPCGLGVEDCIVLSSIFI